MDSSNERQTINQTEKKKTYSKNEPINCNICKRSFKRNSMKAHMRIHEGDGPFKCRQCGFSFNQQYSLIEHQIVHTRNAPLKCHLCSASFYVSNHLILHVSKHNDKTAKNVKEVNELIMQKLQGFKTKENKKRCEICDDLIKVSYFETHMRNHTRTKTIKCAECGLGFSRSILLKDHAIIHNRDGPIKCTLCTASFFHNHHFKKHMLLHNDMLKKQKNVEKEKEKKEETEEEAAVQIEFNCDLCSESFYDGVDIAEHMMMHSRKMEQATSTNQQNGDIMETADVSNDQEENEAKKCQICGLKINISSNMNAHMEIHRRNGPIKCPICPASFNQRNGLTVHMSGHIRQMQVSNEDILKLENSFKEEETPSKCKECGLEFAKKDQYESHLLSHTRNCHFKCTMCTASFSAKKTLKKHMNAHFRMMSTQLTSNEVDSLSKTSASVEQSTDILETENAPTDAQEASVVVGEESAAADDSNGEEEETLLKCKECGIKCSGKERLEIHSIIHTRNGPLKCTMCSASFTMKSTLSAHMNAHYREMVPKPTVTKVEKKKVKPISCEECDFEFSDMHQLEAHMIVHNRNERHKCTKCSASFGKKNGLTLHMSGHYRIMIAEVREKFFQDQEETSNNDEQEMKEESNENNQVTAE